jgi:kinetochor protein Mis14/NSL1
MLKRRVPARAEALALALGKSNGDTEDDGAEGARPGADQSESLGLEPLERQDGVERGFAGAVAALGKLKKEMPATVARMERARVAGEYVVTER